MDKDNTLAQPTRRNFFSTAVATTSALAGFHVAGPAFGKNYDRLRVGVVGCGGRGRGAAEQILLAGPNVEVVALADIAQESAAEARRKADAAWELVIIARQEIHQPFWKRWM